MNLEAILRNVGRYYDEKFAQHGPTPRGVDWNSPEAQERRFEQLLKVGDFTGAFSLNDYGCGYGALVDYLTARCCTFQYHGFDISQAMVAKAQELHKKSTNCSFVSDESHIPLADYTLASGLFNVKLTTSNDEWHKYLLHTLKKIVKLSEKGFAFNVLTIHCDQELMRSDLYYADPCALFSYCVRTFSRNVTLLHDYGLHEFTILVNN